MWCCFVVDGIQTENWSGYASRHGVCNIVPRKHGWGGSGSRAQTEFQFSSRVQFKPIEPRKNLGASAVVGPPTAFEFGR